MADDAIALEPASRLASLIREKRVSSRELLSLYLERIERLNPVVNAVVTLDAERAMEAAARADEATAAGAATGPLHGLPITVKDAIAVAGLRSTGGATALRDHVPSADAPAVARLRHAGAVVFGKTNVPEWSGDIQTFNEMFGTTNNPWDLTRTPGGSSGGCAAALAAGLTPLSFGSDIAGSIRIPANFCGVYGHKPTYGLLPQRGHIPGPPGQLRARDINVVGPLARDARDLDLAVSVLAGPLGQEALGWQLQPPPGPGRPLERYRVAAWLDEPACPVDSSVTERLGALVEALSRAGVAVDTEARPAFSFEEAFELFQKLLWLREDEQLTHAEWLRLDERRQGLVEAWAALFTRYDALLCPVCSTPPFPHDQRPRDQRRYLIDGRPRPLSDYVAWVGIVGVAYLPSTSTPLGRNRDGLPVGVQVVGPPLGDRRSIELAGLLGRVIGGFGDPPPGFLP